MDLDSFNFAIFDWDRKEGNYSKKIKSIQLSK